MPRSKTQIRIRPLEVKDFSFVRELAAQQPNFTIPPPYVLWLLMKINNDVCLIAEDEASSPLGYLLAVPTSDPPDSLYVWQLVAANARKDHSVIRELLLELHGVTRRSKTMTIVFSAPQESSSFKAIRKQIREISGKEPVFTSVLPTIVAPNESEFQVALR